MVDDYAEALLGGFRDYARQARFANGHAREDQGAEQPPATITPIRFTELAGRSPPRRRFIVDQWLPAGCVTSLYGPGGIGKSLLAQQIATCVAIGRPLFEMTVEKGPVLGLMAEDDDHELWRRQLRVNDWIVCSMDDLENLHLEGRAGLENTLALYPSWGTPTAGSLYEAIRATAAKLRPNLIILDPIAQLYGGNENERFQVSHFLNMVGGLAREFDCAVLLLGHPGKAEGSEYSGSTAWNASVRSRLLLQKKEGQEDTLTLSRVKSNYAKPDSVELQWKDGILRPTAPLYMTLGDKIDAEAKAGTVRTSFLKALDKLNAQGRNVSHSSRAGNYAPKVIIEAGLANGASQHELEQALNQLLNDGRVLANQKLGRGADRHPVHGLARAGGEADHPAPSSDGAVRRGGPPIEGDTPARTSPDTCGPVPARKNEPSRNRPAEPSRTAPNACIHCGGHCAPSDTANSVPKPDGRWAHLDCELVQP